MTNGCNGRGCHKLVKDATESVTCLDIGGNKLDTFNWLEDIPEAYQNCDIIEVRFKNTRKAYFKNVNDLKLKKGDIVAVEASPGHDIGIVSLTGALVRLQLERNNIPVEGTEFRKIYRKAKPADIDKWNESMALEFSTMIKSRKIALDLKLDMKIGDVEYQGDGTKAIFYYIADDRVDFRELIKVLAEQLKVRIEMKQIGARQEAGRIGGIGSCGRELCCSTWITSFVSVTTNAARYQEVSLNPQKLAGQCGKLKCCLNYELACYLDAQQDFPNTSVPLETEQGPVFHQKTDVFKRLMWYSSKRDMPAEIICLSVDHVKEIQEKNRRGEKVKKLESVENSNIAPIIDYQYKNAVDEKLLTRFEDKPGSGGKPQNKKRHHHNKHRR
ncbi:MAG TPA: regulatory iron-sulfur-containing complex subunit RicT [Bacteroidales bacterium]|nr:regulatory iron-sulfur-containing complex subunit RicT [Bacteroidales bacterium]